VTNPNESPTPIADIEEPTRPAGAGDNRGGFDALFDVSIPVVVEFGRTNMMLQDVLELGPGSVIQLDRNVGETVDVFVSNRKLAAGEIVVVDDRIGIQITELIFDRNGGSRE